MRLVRLTPRFVEKIWGATRLEPWFAGTGAQIGEVWFEGADDLPLLVKFIFTSEKLSVQVHPDDDYAALHHNSRGKTEMWHVLAAEPGSRIAAGFHQPVSWERLRSAALSGEIEDLLEWHPAAPGDTFFLPSGTVHAIGPGLALCEIQQHSDVTYRLYDYGRPRELHLDHALAVSRREPHPARQTPAGDELVSCPYFSVTRKRIESHSPLVLPGGGDSSLLIITEGEGQIGGERVLAGEVWSAEPGAQPLEASGNLTLLIASPPLMLQPRG